ncbi:SAVED domain-containing protein [Priestia megaterium]|uniref:SAVED domain-containing protein n=1 Tax=Priestia megaterium TaxID=1404 RepID=UPI001BE80CF1|nr:SAVED domain-containing protein [Priestia megaterium]MBT2259647.1 SAVED domain-containing protein [Priestia megaterium]MBT2280907.1 SAVED domain-containing protein [Priestia megaterium]
MTLSTIFLVIAAIVLVLGVIFFIKHFNQRRREEALSDLLITVGIEMMISSFGMLDDKLFSYLNHVEVETNYVQLGVGLVLFLLGVAFYFYVKNRLYILNINGYFDKRIEQHHQDLNLSSFEFKEREIDFTRLFRKGINDTVSKEIQEIISEKMSVFKVESKDKSRAYTGIAPIPFIFLSGKLFERENIDKYFEYDKFNQTYYALTPCRKKRKTYPTLETITPINPNNYAEEIVIAISLTQQILDADLNQFSCPIIHLAVSQPNDNIIKYTDQLETYTQTIYQLLINIPNDFSSLKKVHLVYSGQSCLAFEVGKLMNDQQMVEITSYHYMRQNNLSYPWGIVLNGNRKGTYIEI